MLRDFKARLAEDKILLQAFSNYLEEREAELLQLTAASLSKSLKGLRSLQGQYEEIQHHRALVEGLREGRKRDARSERREED